ncbi:hypothetical protein [Granulicella aggregans]|uniref:hypothetical protein n=1 Tax=Granulicella aggregans TaxID=474949 RepID=UPI0021DFFE83|nr:hypothetical protein [Granulicella aggregans]
MATAEKTNEVPAQQPGQQKVGATPSGPKGDNPATAGPGKTDVNSNTTENGTGHINPSAPEDSNITPGSMPEK